VTKILRMLAAIWLVAAAAATHAEVPAVSSAIQGFHTAYELRYAGLRADATIDLKPTETPGEYLYSVTTKTRGLARLIRPGTATEVAKFIYDHNGFRPLSYHLDDGVPKEENDSDVQFDWAKGTAVCRHESQTVELQIQVGMLDRLTSDIVAIQSLRDGRPLGEFDVVDRNEIQRYEFTPQGEETIKVPAGTFKTIKYLRGKPGSSRATMIWFAPDAAYLPVKLAQLKRGKSTVEMYATVLEPAAAPAPR